MDKQPLTGTDVTSLGGIWRDEVYTPPFQEALLQTLMAGVPDMIAHIGAEGQLSYVSPSSQRLVGMAPELLHKRSLYELIQREDCERVRDGLARALEAGEAVTSEFRIGCSDGSTRWIEMHCQRIEEGDNYAIAGVLRDVGSRRQRLEHEMGASTQQEVIMDLLKKQIDEHQRNRAALEQSERRYTTLVENTMTGFYIHDGNALLFCNERFAQIFGIDRDNPEHLGTQGIFAGGRTIEALLCDPRQEELVEGRGCDGRLVWLKVSRARMVYRSQGFVVGNVVDVTDQMATNERLQQSEQELHALSAQLMAAQEVERKRIANELHDGLGQRLSAIKFAVENIWRSTDSKAYPEQAHRLCAVIESMRDAIEEVRRVSMDLRPSILDDLGLIATIGWFCREFNQLFPDIRVHRTIDASEADIPDDIKVMIFRIIQEAFHNITKHAQAGEIELSLSSHLDSLHLQIRDNGRGMSTIDGSPCAKGLGLKSMRERAEQSHGEFRINSVPGQGTSISVVWPRV